MPLIDPIAQYPTTQLGQGGLPPSAASSIGATTFPGLQGKYVFGDLNRGDGSGGRLLYTDFADPALNVFDLKIVGAVQKPDGAFVHGVAEDANGEIYYLFGNGQIMKLVAPEPAAWALIALAAPILTWRRRRS